MDVKKVIFWDIDGTLIDAAGAGVQAWLEGMRACFDLEGNIEGIRWAGRTDPYIGRLFFDKFGLEMNEENYSKFIDSYAAHLPGELERRSGRVLVGIPELLTYVRDQSPHTAQALLTGNVAIGAQYKLSYFGLWDFFPFGSFADGVFDRNELSPIALNLAREHLNPELEGEDLIIIGDTPYDVQCGKVIGATTVAVATGHFSTDDLAGESPDFLYPDFSDTKGVIQDLEL